MLMTKRLMELVLLLMGANRLLGYRLLCFLRKQILQALGFVRRLLGALAFNLGRTHDGAVCLFLGLSFLNSLLDGFPCVTFPAFQQLR